MSGLSFLTVLIPSLNQRKNSSLEKRTASISLINLRTLTNISFTIKSSDTDELVLELVVELKVVPELVDKEVLVLELLLIELELEILELLELLELELLELLLVLLSDVLDSDVVLLRELVSLVLEPLVLLIDVELSEVVLFTELVELLLELLLGELLLLELL